MESIPETENSLESLPANYIFWEKWDGTGLDGLWTSATFPVKMYKTTKCNPRAFYKPIARVIPLTDLYERGR